MMKFGEPRIMRAAFLLVASIFSAGLIACTTFYFYVGRDYVFGHAELYPTYALAQPGYYVQMSLAGWVFVGLPIAVLVFFISLWGESRPRVLRIVATLTPVMVSVVPGFLIYSWYGTGIGVVLVALVSAVVATAIYGLAFLLAGYYRPRGAEPSVTKTAV